MSGVGQFKESVTPSLVRKVILLAFLFCLCGYSQVVSAATDISQPITADTTWSQAGSPYVILSPITVSTGVTLTIQEGVVVKFEDTQGLTVLGSLQIQGQADLPVTFTSVHDDTVAGDTNQNGTSTQPGGIYYRWSGVTFSAGSTGEISHSKFNFAGYQRTGVPPKPAVYNQGGTVTIKDSTFEKNGQFGAGQTAGSLTIVDTVFDLQNIGVAVKSGDVSITRTTFKNASHFGLIVGGAGALTISESNFINNYYPAGFWLDATRQIQMNNNQTSGSSENGILLRGPVVGNVTLPQTGGISYIVSGVGGTPDGSGALSFPNANGLEVSAGSSLTLTNGAILKSKNEVGIEVKGGLNLLGTPTDPVIYTAINDNTVGGNVQTTSVQPNFGSGGYLRFHPGSTGEINNTTIKYGSNPFRATASALVNNGGVVNVTDSVINENKQYAIYQLAGATTIHTSSIGNAGRPGVFNSLATPLDATNNYWGDPTGPNHPTVNPTGLGASISDNVSVTPWLGVYPPEPPAPLGASSILFLPGIMGSRLYEESDTCDDEGVIEQERWFSTNECDQLRLKTDFTGQSLNTLYTKPSESAVIDNVLLVSPLYGDFLERLADEKENETIADYRAVPYDWRLRLEDILKTREENGKIVFDQSSTYQQSYLYKSLEELVSSSKSGKVTIVAHSNGGLLAKALLAEMEINNDPLLDKVDNLILVAVPQVGTPDAVVSILHGAEIARGFLIKGEVSRQIVNTAPFSHHLLPSEKYFSPEGSSVQTPVIKIEPGSVTDTWRTQFGSEISTRQGLSDFLSKDSGRIKPAADDLLNPEVVDNFLLNYADTAHSVQSAFVPPSTMKVSQVAGTGVGTPSSITYFTDKECISRSIFSFFRCTEYRDKLGYQAVFASDGDGTVVLPSALAMSETYQVERVWVDLFEYNDNFLDRVHRNILDVPDIQDFVFNTVEATTTRQYDYLSKTPVEAAAEDRLVFQLHSPLDMWVTTGNGLVSSSTTEVAGALYERLGELQYIEIPASEDNVEVHLLGQKTGSFTLDIEHWQGGLLEERIDYVAVPTAPGTKITSEIKSILSTSVLELDLEGNGTVDADMTAEGELIEKNVVSYPVLITTIEQLSLKKSLKQVLVTTVKSAEYYSSKTPTLPLHLKLEDALLTAATDLIKLYAKKGYISTSDSEVLLGMIQILKNKQ